MNPRSALSACLSLLLLLPHSAPGAVDLDPLKETRLPPAEILKLIQDGNRRFAAGAPSHADLGAERREMLAKGQAPHTIVLSCSDSRVPPELIFDQGLGDIFTIRVAGNILGAAQVASIEYAIEHLGSRLIVVLGHDSCGAVKAAITTPTGKSLGSKDLDWLVASIQTNLDEAGIGHSPALAKKDETVHEPVRENARAVAQDLLRRSKVVKKAVHDAELLITDGVYNLASGKVEFRR